MSACVNRVTLLGNVGRDPEVRATQSGTKIANLTLATSETWTDKGTGQRQEKTEWHRVTVLNERLADVVERYVHKGSKLYIEGALQTRKWTDRDGQERYTTEVVLGRFNATLVLLDAKQSGAGDPPAVARRTGGMSDLPRDLDDEIPF